MYTMAKAATLSYVTNFAVGAVESVNATFLRGRDLSLVFEKMDSMGLTGQKADERM